MKYPIESIFAYVPMSRDYLKDMSDELRYIYTDQLATTAHITAVKEGKPERTAGHYKSRFKRGRFVDFISMRVTTEQPEDYFIRNQYAIVMRARAMFTRNRRARWIPRK